MTDSYFDVVRKRQKLYNDIPDISIDEMNKVMADSGFSAYINYPCDQRHTLLYQCCLAEREDLVDLFLKHGGVIYDYDLKILNKRMNKGTRLAELVEKVEWNQIVKNFEDDRYLHGECQRRINAILRKYARTPEIQGDMIDNVTQEVKNVLYDVIGCHSDGLKDKLDDVLKDQIGAIGRIISSAQEKHKEVREGDDRAAKIIDIILSAFSKLFLSHQDAVSKSIKENSSGILKPLIKEKLLGFFGGHDKEMQLVDTDGNPPKTKFADTEIRKRDNRGNAKER